MDHAYYIAGPDGNDGPLDLVAVMRRIRSGKVGADTLIYMDGAEKAVPAGEIPDIALFFRHAEITAPSAGQRVLQLSLYQHLVAGWHFTQEHNVMTVYAGGLLLMSLLLGMVLAGGLGLIPGLMLGWVGFLVLQHFYLLFALRLHRGQTAGSDFVNQHIAPVLPRLLLASVLLALMTAGGMALLVLPGMAVMALYVFVPFLILDRRYRPAEAMHASRLLLAKGGMPAVARAAGLVALHLICLMLIVPAPLTLPMIAASLSRLYEELSAA